MHYLAVITKELDKYVVAIPDFPLLGGTADDLEKAIESAEDELLLHLESLSQCGVEEQIPRSIKYYKNTNKYNNGLWVLINS